MRRAIREDLRRGRSLFHAGEHRAALPHLQRVLAEKKDFADIHHMVGVILLDDERRKEAQTHFEAALRINPRFGEAALNLAILYNEQGRYGDAREVYRRARLERPQAGDRTRLDEIAATRLGALHAELADNYVAAGQLERAAEHLCAAVKECPGFLDYRARLASILRDLGRNRTALDILLTLKQTHPDYLAARVQLGLCQWLEKDVASAREEWSFVLRERPDHALARFYLTLVENPSAESDWSMGFFG